MRRGFFRKLWRFNALVIAACGLLGLFLALFAAYHVARDLFRSQYHADRIARVEPAPPSDGATTPPILSETQFDVSGFTAISGTPILWAPVMGKQSYDYRMSSKEASSTRNYIFYNTSTDQSSTLLPGSNELIIRADMLRQSDDQSYGAPPLALLLQILSEDSNKDGILSEDDKVTVALAQFDGQRLTRLDVKGRIIGTHVPADGKTLVLMLDDAGTLSAVHVDLATFGVLKTVAIPR